MIKLREFTDIGIEQFEYWLREQDESERISPHNFNKEPFSIEIDTPRDVLVDETKVFKNRLELGSHLSQKLRLGGINRDDVLVKEPEKWNNVWSWLASLWADQFIPIRNGLYKLPSLTRFIGSADYRRFYRHFVATPYWLYSLHGEEHSKIFLDCPPQVHNEFIEQIGSRQWIITSTDLVTLAYKIYWDTNSDCIKRGSSGKGAGSVRRFARIMNQFSLTYDVHNMNPDEILSMLPSEFDQWL